MALTKIQNGMLDNSAVSLNNLNATGSPTSDKLLDGAFNWQINPASLTRFDFGQVNAAASNLIDILLQASAIDFNNLTLGYDAGTI